MWPLYPEVDIQNKLVFSCLRTVHQTSVSQDEISLTKKAFTDSCQLLQESMKAFLKVIFKFNVLCELQDQDK